MPWQLQHHDGRDHETTSDTPDQRPVSRDANVSEANELIQAGDKRLIACAKELATAPETKDRVIISSTHRSSGETTPQETAGDATHYELILRA